jgi:RNA polymerase sigma-70 factor (ECF subfamily)
VGSRDGEVSRELLDACRVGDRDALRALYEAYKDRVYSIAYYFFRGDPTAASDVTQQVFLKLIDGMAKYRGDSAFSTWLYRIVVNACVDRSRRWRAEAATEPAVLDEMPARGSSHEDLFARGELAQSVQDAIAALPPTLRLPILLRYFDELSYAEMAAALHCSIGTISSRLSRGHRLLARRLAPIVGVEISERGVKEERRQGVPGDPEERRQSVPGDPEERRQSVPGDPEERRQGVPGDQG